MDMYDKMKIEELLEEYEDNYEDDLILTDTRDILLSKIISKVPSLLRRINELEEIVQNSTDSPLYPCSDCGKEERNPGLDCCGECYHRRITGK